MSAAPSSWSQGGATSVLIEAFPLRMLRGYLRTVSSVAFGSQWSLSQPVESVVFAYYRLRPHCGCDPAKDRVAMLDTPYAMLE